LRDVLEREGFLELNRDDLPLTIRVRGREVRDYVIRPTASGGVVMNRIHETDRTQKKKRLTENRVDGIL